MVLAAALLTSVSARAQSPADVALARELFREGAKYAQEGEWNEARQRYEKSLALRRAPLTLYSLGMAYRNLRRFVESLESYRAFLVEMRKDDEKDKPYEQPAREAVAELEKLVASVDIKVRVDEDVKYLLTVDGIIVPEAAYGYPRLVDPGRHMVKAHVDGHPDATRDVTLGEGEKQVVILDLGPIGKGDGSSRGTGRPKAGGGGSPLQTVLLIGGGATFIAGLTVGLIGVQQAMDAPTRDGRDAMDAWRLALAGDIMAGVGIAAAGTGLTLVLLGKYNKPSRADTKPAAGWVVPVVTTNSVGLVGKF